MQTGKGAAPPPLGEPAAKHLPNTPVHADLSLGFLALIEVDQLKRLGKHLVLGVPVSDTEFKLSRSNENRFVPPQCHRRGSHPVRVAPVKPPCAPGCGAGH